MIDINIEEGQEYNINDRTYIVVRDMDALCSNCALDDLMEDKADECPFDCGAYLKLALKCNCRVTKLNKVSIECENCDYNWEIDEAELKYGFPCPNCEVILVHPDA